jgi:hypothetical protein
MPEDDKKQNDRQKKETPVPAPTSFPLKPSGEVVVTHHDAPPRSEPRRIHPRRPAPIVPERRPEPATDESEDK